MDGGIVEPNNPLALVGSTTVPTAMEGVGTIKLEIRELLELVVRAVLEIHESRVVMLPE